MEKIFNDIERNLKDLPCLFLMMWCTCHPPPTLDPLHASLLHGVILSKNMMWDLRHSDDTVLIHQWDI
jgi:hypothetical protein